MRIEREEFVECPSCREKPGTPVLCPDCIARRDRLDIPEEMNEPEKIGRMYNVDVRYNIERSHPVLSGPFSLEVAWRFCVAAIARSDVAKVTVVDDIEPDTKKPVVKDCENCKHFQLETVVKPFPVGFCKRVKVRAGQSHPGRHRSDCCGGFSAK